jgi:hypothetical protein
MHSLPRRAQHKTEIVPPIDLEGTEEILGPCVKDIRQYLDKSD